MRFPSKVRAELMVGRFIIILLILLYFGSGVLVTLSHHRDILNATRDYGYLSKYRCWSDEFLVTYYTLRQSECGKSKSHAQYGITRSGIRAIPDFTVAVDPLVIPLGSILLDPETGKRYLAMDTGRDVKGNHVDMFVGPGTKANVEKAIKLSGKTKMFMVIE